MRILGMKIEGENKVPDTMSRLGKTAQQLLRVVRRITGARKGIRE